MYHDDHFWIIALFVPDAWMLGVYMNSKSTKVKKAVAKNLRKTSDTSLINSDQIF